MYKCKQKLMLLSLILALFLSGCTLTSATDNADQDDIATSAGSSTAEVIESLAEGYAATSSNEIYSINLSDIPEYGEDPYVVINNNIPFFEDEEKTTEVFELYSELDSLGRCGVAYANICIELMPTDARESISEVTPSGWHNAAYDFVDGGYVYNRCHLIGFQLAGENANELNLITGTRYMNVDGMLSFENLIDDYVEDTENHVLYRVTPMYDGDNLVASGVLMEAWSVEDDGNGVCFCIFCYNVQPGVIINYATGYTTLDEDYFATDATGSIDTEEDESAVTYILNTNSMKFHKPTCDSVTQMSEKNKAETTLTRDELIADGYTPCGSCNP